MSFVFEIDPQQGLICKRGRGEVDAEGFCAQLVAETTHPDFRPGLRKIVDYDLLRPSFSASGIRKIADQVRDLEDRVGTAQWAIVSDDDVVYGLTRMFMAVSEGSRIEVNVFRDMERARAWLRLPDDYRCPFVA